MAGLMAWLVSDTGLSATRPVVTAFGVAAEQTAQQPGLKALTSGAHMDGFSAWSPDGKQLAFMRDGRIWLMSAAGQGARALTRPDGAWDAAPAWRPDGKQIAYIRLFPNEDRSQIWSIDPESGKETKLLDEPEAVGYLAWAPSGANLYYTTAQRLMRTEATGGKPAQVIKVSGDWELLAGGLAVSHDGKSIVFGAGPRMDQGVAYDLWRLPLNGKQQDPERLTQGGGIMPAFDPQDKRIAYRNPRQSTGLYMMNLSTHSTKRFLADAPKTMYFHPAFSPDGKSLAVSQLSLDSAGQGQEGRFISHLYVVQVPKQE